MVSSAYQQWQELLAHEFFDPSRGSAPVILFIDDQEAARLRSDSGGVGTLEDAVSESLDWRGSAYARILREVRLWQRTLQAEPPPCLPLLATSVLAATRMRSDALARSHAYYLRLAEVLRPPQWFIRDPAEHLQKTYRDVRDLWLELDSWIERQHGSRGRSTIRNMPSGPFIGYAQSQAILRSSDHAALTRFFHRERLDEGVTVSAAVLLNRLQIWGRRRSEFSPRLREALASGTPTELKILESLIGNLAESWDMRVVLPRIDGIQQVALKLSVHEDLFEGWRLGWYSPVNSSLATDSLRYGSHEFTLGSAPDMQSYILGGEVPDPAAALEEGLSARGQRCAIRFAPGRDVIAMCPDPVAGAWVETDELAVHETYLFLVNKVGESRLRRIFEHTRTHWYEPDDTSVEGWQVVPEIEFTDETLLREALAKTPITGAELEVERGLRLAGGLPVARGLGRRHFLVGGEPDVLLSGPAMTAEIRLDHTVLPLAPGGCVVLRGRSLRPGEHTIETAGCKIDFVLHAPSPLPPSPPTGAIESPMLDGRVVVPHHADSRFIEANGRYVPIPKHPLPRWWADRATEIVAVGGYQTPVPEEAVWLAVVYPDGRNDITLLHSAPPQIGHLSDKAAEFWARLVLDSQSGKPHAALWHRYCQAVLSHEPGAV